MIPCLGSLEEVQKMNLELEALEEFEDGIAETKTKLTTLGDLLKSELSYAD